jgi:WD40 repeat protein
VRYVTFSPDGARILTTSDTDRTARIWDAETGRSLHVLEGHETRLLARFSPDGSRVITADTRGEVRIWRADGTRWFLDLDEHAGRLWAAALSADGSRVATAADGAVRIWDSRTGQPIGEPLAHDQPVRALAFSPDGSRLATASGDSAFVWTLESDRDTVVFTRLFTVGHRGLVRSVAFRADGARLLTASHDETARLWEGETGAPVGEPMQHEDQVYTAAFGPDGRIATGSEEWAGVWSSAGEFQRALDPEGEVLEEAVYSVAFSPDGRRLVTAVSRAAHVWVLDGQEDRPRYTFDAGSIVESVAFGSDTLVVTVERGVRDNPARVTAWNAQTGDMLYSLGSHADAVRSVALSADGALLVTASQDGTARVWPMDWEGLLLGIREYATHACLTVAQRKDLLGESNQAAEDAVRACRDRHQAANVGRQP